MKFLIDSNIIIYSVLPAHQYLRDYLKDKDLIISKITLLEVLGYHKLTSSEKADFSRLFQSINQIPISEEVIEVAIKLSQRKKLSVGDSIIAASAILSQATLLTANLIDFIWITELKAINPIQNKNI